MRYWLFMLFLFTVIVFSRVAKAPEDGTSGKDGGNRNRVPRHDNVD